MSEITGADVGRPRAELDLRERRRIATAADINHAALQLFETRGVDGTTVVDIARLAGVSPRTFFRYFETKEMAALVDLNYTEFIDEWSRQGNVDVDVFTSMLTMLRAGLERMDQSDARQRMLRMRRLIRTEQAVRIASMRTNADHTLRLEQALRARAASSGLATSEAIILARAAGAMIDAAIEHWEKLTESGDNPELGTVFDSVCEIVGQAFPHDRFAAAPANTTR